MYKVWLRLLPLEVLLKLLLELLEVSLEVSMKSHYISP